VNFVQYVSERVDSIADRGVRLDARLVYVLACSHAALARVASKEEVAELGVNADDEKERATDLLEKAFAGDLTGDLRVWSKTDPDLANLDLAILRGDPT
jgi:hypothetical protein